MGVVVPTGEFGVSLWFHNGMIAKDQSVTFGALNSVDDDPFAVCTNIYDALVTNPGVNPSFCEATSMASGWSFLGVDAFFQDASGPIGASFRSTVAGTGSDNDVPVNCAVLMTKSTATGGRHGRGRSYWPPFFAAMTTDSDGSLGGVTGAFLDAVFAQVLTELTFPGVQLVLHHADGSAGTLITSVSFSESLATQRRRMR